MVANPEAGALPVSRKPLEDSLPSSAVAVLATTYVGMLTGSLIRLRNDFPEGWKLVFFLLLVVWLGDSGAYYFGKSFGKRKLSPRTFVLAGNKVYAYDPPAQTLTVGNVDTSKLSASVTFLFGQGRLADVPDDRLGGRSSWLVGQAERPRR